MKRKVKELIYEISKLLVGILIIIPLIVVFVAAFQPAKDILSMPYQLTFSGWTLDSFSYALEYMNVGTYMKNTFIMIAICLPIRMITALLAAYAFSHFDFPCKSLLFSIILMGMMIPGEAVIITLFKMAVDWDLVNTYAGLCMTSVMDVSAVFLFRQNMLSMPKSLREAAVLDGCSDMKYFATILVPLCKSVIVAQALISFINLYNTHLWPVLVTTKDAMRTIQVGVQGFFGAEHYGYTLAATCLTFIVPLVIYFFGLKKITSGMMAGAVKN